MSIFKFNFIGCLQLLFLSSYMLHCNLVCLSNSQSSVQDLNRQPFNREMNALTIAPPNQTLTDLVDVALQVGINHIQAIYLSSIIFEAFQSKYLSIVSYQVLCADVSKEIMMKYCLSTILGRYLRKGFRLGNWVMVVQRKIKVHTLLV